MSTNSKSPKRRPTGKEDTAQSRPASLPLTALPAYWIVLGAAALLLIGAAVATGLAIKGRSVPGSPPEVVANGPVPGGEPAEPVEPPAAPSDRAAAQQPWIPNAPELIPAPAAVFAASTEAAAPGKDKEETRPPETRVAQAKDKETKKDPAGRWPVEILGKDLDRWILEIKDPDAANRQAAIRTVIQFGPAAQKALSALAGRLYQANERDPGVRVDAVSAIRLLGLANQEKKLRENIVLAVSNVLGDEHVGVRIQAVNAMGQFGAEARGEIAKLTSRLQDPSWEVRAAAARALSSVARGDPEQKKGPDVNAVNALLDTRLLGDPCASVRMEVITALSILGSPEKLQAVEKKALEDRMLKEKDHRVKIWVRLLLMYMDEKGHMTKTNFDALIKELESDDARVRAQAAQALGTLGKNADKQAGVATALTKAVYDKELEVRLAAITALPRLGNPACIPVLTRILKDEKEEMAVRTQIARSMWVLGKDGKVFLDELTALLTNKDAELVLAAISGIAAFGEAAHSAIPALKGYDPEALSYDSHIKDITKAATEEARRTKDAVKAAADEAVRQIYDAKSPKK
jgi:HEAT repeat protein